MPPVKMINERPQASRIRGETSTIMFCRL